MTYHLAYMNLRARGEPIRWLLKALELSYTEERIEAFTDWPTRKKDFEWGQTPVLMVDGEQLHQTTNICHYLGNKHQLASTDLWTAARQQEVVEAFHDVTFTISLAFIARVYGDETQQKTMIEKAKKRVIEIVPILENRITEEGWIHSHEMTWVDVFLAAYLDSYEIYFPEIQEGFPKVHALMERVKALPPIKSWLEERPGWHKFEDPDNLV